MTWTGTPLSGRPDYAAYVAFGGQLAAGPFTAALPSAAAAVDAAIWPNVVTDASREAYRAAICAVVDLIDSPAVTSWRAGNASETYADAPTIDTAITRHLTGSGLLYRGL